VGLIYSKTRPRNPEKWQSFCTSFESVSTAYME